MDKICKNCSKNFNVTKKHLIKSKVFCSLSCSQEWWMKKKNKTGKFIGDSKKAGIKAREYLTLNHNQYQLILGSMLGDGYIRERINKNFNSYCYSEGHSIIQKEYLTHKMKILKGFIVQKSLTNIKPNGFSPNPKVSMTSIIHKDFEEIFHLFYRTINGFKNKFISIETLNQITPLGLLYWYLDDGDISKKNNIKFSTYSFGEEGNLILQRWLSNTYGIKSLISIDKRKNLYYLRLNVNDTKKLLELISPYKSIIPMSMSYKFLLR
jgi:hypothetical protein